MDNVYTRAVQVQPNPRARELLAEVFAPATPSGAAWELIPGSGVTIREPYARFDARTRFSRDLGAPDPAAALPLPLRRGAPGRPAPGGSAPCSHKACTPAQPLGPCMVSSEGACAAAYRYERWGFSVFCFLFSV